MPSVTEITVRYAETDCMGVTHHAVYPVWFEVARTDYIKNAAVSYAEMERRGGGHRAYRREVWSAQP